MKLSAFVRIRPEGVVEDALRSDDPEVQELVQLALAPLPDDAGEGEWGFGDEALIFGLTRPERVAASGGFRMLVR